MFDEGIQLDTLFSFMHVSAYLYQISLDCMYIPV